MTMLFNFNISAFLIGRKQWWISKPFWTLLSSVQGWIWWISA